MVAEFLTPTPLDWAQWLKLIFTLPPGERQNNLLAQFAVSPSILAEQYDLSERLWGTRARQEAALHNVLDQAIGSKVGARDLAKHLQQYLDPAYARTKLRGDRVVTTGHPAGGGSYEARRLARTEITAAAGRGTIAASDALATLGAKVAWALSGSHPEDDECDANATRGPYDPKQVPRYPAHPNCLCTLRTVFAKSDAELVAAVQEEFGLTPAPAPEELAKAREIATLEAKLADLEARRARGELEYTPFAMEQQALRQRLAELKRTPEQRARMEAIRAENQAALAAAKAKEAAAAAKKAERQAKLIAQAKPAAEWTNMKDMNAWAAKHLPTTKLVGMKDFDLALAKDTFTQMEVMIRDFPDAARTISSINLTSNKIDRAYAQVWSGDNQLDFNLAHYKAGNSARLRQEYALNRGSNWNINEADGNPGTTMTHEFGHVLHNWLLKQNRSYVFGHMSASGIESVSTLTNEWLKQKRSAETLSRYSMTPSQRPDGWPRYNESFAEGLAAIYHDPRKYKLKFIKEFDHFLDITARHPERWHAQDALRFTQDMPLEERRGAIAETQELLDSLGMKERAT